MTLKKGYQCLVGQGKDSGNSSGGEARCGRSAAGGGGSVGGNGGGGSAVGRLLVTDDIVVGVDDSGTSRAGGTAYGISSLRCKALGLLEDAKIAAVGLGFRSRFGLRRL
jgi:hypothetical protein